MYLLINFFENQKDSNRRTCVSKLKCLSENVTRLSNKAVTPRHRLANGLRKTVSKRHLFSGRNLRP